MDFYDELFKNCHFWPQNEPKGPQGPIEIPQDDKNYFLSCQDMKTPC